MPTILPANGSLLDTRTLAREDILSVFRLADELRNQKASSGNFFDPDRPPVSRVVALVFFEPSTRTRLSFQMAAERLGFRTLTMEPTASSLTKGETLEDTVLNIAAMEPDAIVIRYGQSVELDHLLPILPIPVLSAGSGAQAHPTQSLLDAYTIHREKGSVEGQRILIVGDIRHSRVARSNFDVLKKLGAEVGVCGPQSFLPVDEECRQLGLRVFDRLDDGIRWANVYMGLRVQIERHTGPASLEIYRSEFHDQFGLNRDRLNSLAKDAIIMHPGPINHGVEFSTEVSADTRNRVMTQVANGVLIRAALLSRLFQKESRK